MIIVIIAGIAFAALLSSGITADETSYVEMYPDPQSDDFAKCLIPRRGKFL